MSDYLNKNQEARDIDRDVTWRLANLAQAFEITGNKTVAELLDWIINQIDRSCDLKDQAFNELFNQACNSASEATGNLLSLALAHATGQLENIQDDETRSLK